MRMMLTTFMALACLATTLANESVDRANKSLKKGAEQLLSVQNADGSFGNKPTPAVTALCAIALADTPIDKTKRDAATAKAMKYLLSFVKEDGSVRGKAGRHFIFFSDAGYPNYTTAVALLAMHTYRKPEYVPLMKAAREYLKTVQVADKDSDYRGGFTYGKGGKADLSNTAWSTEALHYTEYLDEEPYIKKTDKVKKTNQEMWSAVNDFLKKVQNLPTKKNKDLDGGFAYRPGTLVSSGSMTYAGLKSMIYAKVDKKDPRVLGVMKFVRNKYTMDENPGQGLKGHYYYLQTMAKALDALGMVTIKTKDGKVRNWREDMIKKVCDMQLQTGVWFNTNGRYMESDREMVTAYAMITLKYAKRGLK